MSDAEIEKIEPQEIWVDLREAAEITGYNSGSVKKIAQRMERQPEDQRQVKIRKRTSRWELWLPDLIAYLDGPRHGPQRKRKESG